MERFNDGVSEVVNQMRFTSAAELKAMLDNYLTTCKQLIPPRWLNHLPPIQALKKWQAEKPDFFVKRVDSQPGLDN